MRVAAGRATDAEPGRGRTLPGTASPQGRVQGQSSGDRGISHSSSVEQVQEKTGEPGKGQMDCDRAR